MAILLSYLGGMLDICWCSKNERSWPDTLNSSLLDFSGDDRPPKIQKTFSRLDADPALSMGGTGWASLVLESLLIAMAWCGTKSWFDSLINKWKSKELLYTSIGVEPGFLSSHLTNVYDLPDSVLPPKTSTWPSSNRRPTWPYLLECKRISCKESFIRIQTGQQARNCWSPWHEWTFN